MTSPASGSLCRPCHICRYARRASSAPARAAQPPAAVDEGRTGEVQELGAEERRDIVGGAFRVGLRRVSRVAIRIEPAAAPFPGGLDRVDKARSDTMTKIRKGHSLIRSARVPETIDAVVAQNISWKKKSEPTEYFPSDVRQPLQGQPAVSHRVRVGENAPMPQSGIVQALARIHDRFVANDDRR